MGFLVITQVVMLHSVAYKTVLYRLLEHLKLLYSVWLFEALTEFNLIHMRQKLYEKRGKQLA